MDPLLLTVQQIKPPLQAPNYRPTKFLLFMTVPTTTASLNINVEDGNEGLFLPINSAFNLAVNSINDAPTISGDLNATVNSGSSVTLTTTDLNYTDPDDDASGVIFTISSLTNGSITVNGATNQTTFTGAQLAAGQVSFVHDGSASASGTFNVNVEDGNEDSSTLATLHLI